MLKLYEPGCRAGKLAVMLVSERVDVSVSFVLLKATVGSTPLGQNSEPVTTI